MSSAAVVLPRRRHRRTAGGFLEHNLAHLLQNLEAIGRAETISSRSGFLQRLSPRAKLVSACFLVIAIVASTSLPALACAFAAAVLIAIASRVQAQLLMRLVWGSVLIFTGSILLPSLILTPGPPLFAIPLVGWRVTSPGLHNFLLLLARAETSATLLALLALTTPWPRLLRAMQSLHLPVVVIALFATTYRYLVLLLEASVEMFQARRSRMVGPLTPSARRHLLVSTAGVLLHKTAALSQEVHSAMQSRGFRGRVYLLRAEPARRSDSVAVFIAFAAAIALVLAH